MEDLIYYTRLFDLYKNVLTEKQRETFEDYFFENLTIEEIAQNNGVSKNAISKMIKNIKALLLKMEEDVKFARYIYSIKNEFKNEEDILRRLEKYDTII